MGMIGQFVPLPSEAGHIIKLKHKSIMRSRISLAYNLLKKKHDPAQILVKLALRQALAGCESVLDIGCGNSPIMRDLGVSRSVGVEGYRPSFEEAKREKLQDELVECD